MNSLNVTISSKFYPIATTKTSNNNTYTMFYGLSIDTFFMMSQNSSGDIISVYRFYHNNVNYFHSASIVISDDENRAYTFVREGASLSGISNIIGLNLNANNK